ncbi:MAG: NAD(P)H-dependent oxidoreductase subunit E [Clostridia bacterium]
MKVVVCIGSSCHLKGSRQLVENLQSMINENRINDKVELSGTFCMGKCGNDGVSITVDDIYFAVKPENADNFFKNEILKRLAK